MEDMEIRKNFANNISRLRKNAKLNQAQLADELSYSDKAISKWENEDTIPDIITIHKIATFFNVTIDDLISNENVVKKSHQRKNRALITLLSVGISVLIGLISFLFLKIFNVSNSFISLVVTISVVSIVLIVFTTLWYKKIYSFLSITLLIWSIAFLVMIISSFTEALLISIIAFTINLLFALFMAISK